MAPDAKDGEQAPSAPNAAEAPTVPPRAGRLHKATYARDKKKGGYLIRVAGPNAGRFAGRVVPVVRKDDSESLEKLDALIWTGVDDETAQNVALYSFIARPPDESAEDNLPF